MNIVKFPNPILRERMPEFDFANPSHDPVQLERDMLDTMLRYDGIGLAANQVGERARVFVMGHRDSPEPGMAFFNPVVLENTESISDL
jgi:peptide deformylase